MWALVSPRRIISEHYKSLEDDAGKFQRYVIFFGIPLLLSIIVVFIFGKPLTQESIAILVPAFSIFTALLLNVAFLLLNTVGEMGEEVNNEESLKGRLIRSLYVNALYSILISVVILTILILLAIIQPWLILEFEISIFDITFQISPYTGLLAISFAEYILILHFMMNLLMVIKRLHSLLLVQVNIQSSPK